MFEPFHNGHQIKQQGDAGERNPQYNIAFAACTLRIIIPHCQIAKAGSPASFSTIRDANKAVI